MSAGIKISGPLKAFTCTYRFEGKRFGITVEARSWEEASARFRAIGMTAVVEGEQIVEGQLFPAGLVGCLKSTVTKLLRRPAL